MKRLIRTAKIVIGAVVVGVLLTGCSLVEPVATSGVAPTPISVAVSGDAKDPTPAPASAAPAPTSAAPTVAPAPDLPAAAPTRQDYDDVGLATLAYLSTEGVMGPSVVGAAATAGDYAVALAGVFLEETGSRYIFLKREAGGWIVLYDSPRPTPEALAQRGIPASLGADFPIYGLHQAVINQLNDPRGPAGNTSIAVEAMDQGFAKVSAVPDDRTARDTPTIYFGPGELGGYTYLIAGTAFFPQDLDQLGIPQSVR